jgi:hypothetical protein
VKPRHVTFARLAKNQRVANMIRGLNGFLRGWHWYFKSIVGRYKEPFESFDTFVRRRVRSAITGRSAGRGWWNQALPNATLRQLGLQWPSDLQIRYAQGHLAAPARKGQLVESRMREIRTYGSGRKEAG